jgi:hypothetical protein
MSLLGAYYAAQIGISLKAKSTGARDLLFELLAVLERMKEELGPSDAVDIESVSSAYVENFALKVFNIADNEDRKGEATRLAKTWSPNVHCVFTFIISQVNSKEILSCRQLLRSPQDFSKDPNVRIGTPYLDSTTLFVTHLHDPAV